jgi:chromosomal replication initiation ATPase DnaA
MKEKIIRSVCENYGIERKKLFKSSKQIDCEARFVCMYFFNKFANINKTKSAAIFIKHYSSAIYAVQKVEDLITIDKKFARKIESLTANLFPNG